jgi:hypothetical protein
MNSVSKWMSWEGGVDVVGLTQAGLSMPNVIVHVARMVHTPVGSAPSGMILWQPDPKGPPAVMGFISTNSVVGGYFGPNIFAGTPFEAAPVLPATIDVTADATSAHAKVTVAGTVFETKFTGLGALNVIHRAPAAMPPFWQQGLEQAAGAVELKVNGQVVPLILPPVGITGGPAAVSALFGLYAR